MSRLAEPYFSRAVPTGSARHWSWLFAHAHARDGLLGIYALLAEWRALLHPGIDRQVAETKIEWWRQEMQRLARRQAVHPISRFLTALPGAAAVDFEPLADAVEAAARQVGGVPLDRQSALAPHANALLGCPLRVAAQFVALRSSAADLRDFLQALALAEYLARAIADYRDAALGGRVLFPVDALLAAGIGNDDLVAQAPPARLRVFLDQLRTEAAEHYLEAARALPDAERPRQRGLLVLAALGAHHLGQRRSPQARNARLQDIFAAWRVALRATRAR